MTDPRNKAQRRSLIGAAGARPASAGRVILGIAAISGVVNLLALTAPMFMLQVYDRVLPSRSVPTLVGLGVLAAGLYAFQALLDVLRARVLVRLSELVHLRLAPAVRRLAIEEPAPPGQDGIGPIRALDRLRSFLAGQGPAALCDLPWMPLYLLLCTALHPYIGLLATLGALLLIAMTLATHLLARAPMAQAAALGEQREAQLLAARRNAAAARAMGFGHRLEALWFETERAQLAAVGKAADVTGALGAVARALRAILQSAILGLGAWLVIGQQVSPGAMIAASILFGRAMAPVDRAIAAWPALIAARQGWAGLALRLAQQAPLAAPMPLPAPVRGLSVRGLTVTAPPGMTAPGPAVPLLQGVSFELAAGSALAIIGPSGGGKSTLAETLAGARPPALGAVRLDGATPGQLAPAARGAAIGYLPQEVALFDASVAENIARFADPADPAAVVAAAQAAGVHGLITSLPEGYATRLGPGGARLSAGQRQRLALARALYGAPFLVVLDEPNANLDAEGEAAVVQAVTAVRRRGGIAVVVAHRPSVLAACDQVATIEGGRLRAFGPRDEILARVLRPAAGPPRPAGPMPAAGQQEKAS